MKPDPDQNASSSHHHIITSSHHQLLVLVALQSNTPFPEPLTYELPPELAPQVTVGSTVLAPLSGREVIGFAVGFPDQPPADQRLRPILAVLDPQPAFDERLYRVATWIADRYRCSLGDALERITPDSHSVSVEHVLRLTDGWPEEEGALGSLGPVSRATAVRLRELLRTAGGELDYSSVKRRLPTPTLPSLISRLRDRGWVEDEHRLRSPRLRTRVVRTWTLAEPDDAVCNAPAARLGPRQLKVLEHLREHPGSQIPQTDLCRDLGVTPAALQALERRGLLRAGEAAINRAARVPLVHTPAPSFTHDQAAAAAALDDAVQRATTDRFLLYGVTGSGKTEVYLRAMEEALAAGRQAIFLVPEISLTAQVAAIFRARFGERVAILHSALSDGERFDEWQRIRRAEADVVVGARSALFAPAPNPGVIVLDEEHDPSYKQDNSPRYVTRAVAEQRTSLSGCPLILGSATPAVETFYRAGAGELRRLDLPRRIYDRPLPEVRVVDLRAEFRCRGATVLSQELSEAVRERLARGEQVILFVNRRGFSAFILCRDCGFVPRCPRCNVSLTFHAPHEGPPSTGGSGGAARRSPCTASRPRLVCHHCGHERRAPEHCPRCAGTRIRHFGIGTQRVEETVSELFPEARLSRLDRDTTTTKDSHSRIVTGFKQGDADILIGTQMVAKGFDFPRVTLVGIITADTALNLPDFRAAERTFQLLTQVAGRAGRGDTPGEVILQTFTPDHYAIQAAARHDYAAFYAEEILNREELQYPPFASLARVVAADTQPDAVHAKINAIRSILAGPAASTGVELLGPTTAPLARLNGKYRWHLLLKSRSDAALQSLLDEVLPALRRQSGWYLDVDPLSLM